MYLALLNEKEKNLFLDFAQFLSASDGNIGVEEVEMLKAYCAEMNISTQFKKSSKSVENIIEEINSVSDDRSKKIIIFELIGLALSDSCYDESEKRLITEAIQIFDMDENYIQECEKVITEYISVQNRVNNLIFG